MVMMLRWLWGAVSGQFLAAGTKGGDRDPDPQDEVELLRQGGVELAGVLHQAAGL